MLDLHIGIYLARQPFSHLTFQLIFVSIYLYAQKYLYSIVQYSTVQYSICLPRSACWDRLRSWPIGGELRSIQLNHRYTLPFMYYHQLRDHLYNWTLTSHDICSIIPNIFCQLITTDQVIGDFLFSATYSDEEGVGLEEFISYVRQMTRNGLFDQYQVNLTHT